MDASIPEIQVFRQLKGNTWKMPDGTGAFYQYQSCQSELAGGLKPAAFACSSVTGNTFRDIPVPSTDNHDLQC